MPSARHLLVVLGACLQINVATIADRPVIAMLNMWGHLLARKASVQARQKFLKQTTVMHMLLRATNVQQHPVALGAWDQANVFEML